MGRFGTSTKSGSDLAKAVTILETRSPSQSDRVRSSTELFAVHLRNIVNICQIKGGVIQFVTIHWAFPHV